MNIKTIIVLFTLGFLVSCSTTTMTEKEKEALEGNKAYSVDPSFRR